MRWRTRGLVGEPDQLLDQPLAAVVGRVRLAGDHELDRALAGRSSSAVSRSRSRSISVSRL